MRTLLCAQIRGLGISRVVECADGVVGYRELCSQKFDCVITDHSMEPIDGIELTRMIRNEKESPYPKIPIVMVTGHTERVRVVAARDAGVTEFIAKPINVQKLLSRLTEIVERPRAFVRCETYFGPDRRRRADLDYQGPWRRKYDLDVD